VASKGERPESNKVPNVKGLTKKEAMLRIYQNSFNVGNVVGDDEKSTGLVVISQTPSADNSTYPLGYKINLRLSGGKKRSDDRLDSLLWNSVIMDRDNEEEDNNNALEDVDNDNNNEEVF
jgi:beta-lactam-binding protein with PASTA domain